MTDLLTIVGFLLGGSVLARAAWVHLEREEHDVLHTHPKLVVALIICGTMILGVQAVGVRYGARGARDGAEALRLVRSAVDPEGEVARSGAAGQVVVVADIEAVTIAATACAQDHDGYDAIRACVIDHLRREVGAPPILVARTTTTTTRRSP